MEFIGCAGLAVPTEVMHHVVRVESAYNPFAIGVVGGRLLRQPKNLPEALSTVRMLESKGYNFSLGLAQVNRYNLSKYGLQSYEQAFDTCPNLLAGSRILAECYSRSGGDWGKSFSCYYSGDFAVGFRHGYVQKIYASMGGVDPASSRVVTVPAIEVRGQAARRVVEVTQYPETVGRASSVVQRIAETSPSPESGPAQRAAAIVPRSGNLASAVPSRIQAIEPSGGKADAQASTGIDPLFAARAIPQDERPVPQDPPAAAGEPAPAAPEPAGDSAFVF